LGIFFLIFIIIIEQFQQPRAMDSLNLNHTL